MQPLLAIITLTWKAAFRYRLFWVVALLLVGAVVGLPMLIKDDGTAEGFAQILITYTLGAVTGLLGLSTLWLACGTLARDVEECQIQMVAVKPIARWQIWLGKWLGLVSLNAALLAVAGACLFGVLEFRARRLPAPIKARLQNEILVSRGSAHEENLDSLIANETDKILDSQKEKFQGLNLEIMRAQIREQVLARYQVVDPDHVRGWIVHLGSARHELVGKPLFLRIKFNTAQITGRADENYACGWQVGVPQQTAIYQEMMNLSPETFHEFPIPPNLIQPNGDVTILFRNMSDTALLFPLNEGLEVLYRQGGFGPNYVRGLAVILAWMALLAALGLAAASFMSFPVAAFVSLAMLAICFSSGTLTNAVQDGTIMGYDSEKSAKGHTPADFVIIPVFRGMLDVINLVRGFSPIDSLSTGRTITWSQLGLAYVQIVLLLGGFLGLFGMVAFSRRELATAQGTV